MAQPRIRLLETLVLKGPNFWSYRPCIWMRIDLGGFQDSPTNTSAASRSGWWS